MKQHLALVAALLIGYWAAYSLGYGRGENSGFNRCIAYFQKEMQK